MVLADSCESIRADRRRSPLRCRIDQQRVQLWFQWIHQLSHGATYYALEKQLIGDGFGRNVEGVLSHRHRMARYAQGKHVPRSDLVERAELKFPRSKAVLEHVYWEILDPEQELTEHRSRWLAGLGPETQLVLYQSRSVASEIMVRREKTSRRLLRRLERLGSFEALAAIALLLREAQAEGNEELAFSCAGSFWVVLLLIGSTPLFVGLLGEMAALAGDALLDHVHHRGERVAIRDAPILLYEQILRRQCLTWKNQGKLAPDWSSWVRARLRLIRGDYGFGVVFALRLPTEATEELRADPERHSAFQKHVFARWKALDYITTADWARRSFFNDWVAYMTGPNARWPELGD